MDVSAESVDDAGAETTTNVLPNEVLLHIFRFLEYEDLISAEQVCWRWKKVVETCFATEKRLSLVFLNENYRRSLKRMKRYGSSIQTLKFNWYVQCASAKDNWVEEIADRFPNLIKMRLCYIQISVDGFKYLSAKCCQLNNVTLHDCSFTAEGLRMFLQALPGITFLKFYKANFTPGLRNPDLADASAVLYYCRNLKSIEMIYTNFGRSDTASVSRFFKECVTLRTLRIRFTDMPAEMFAQIQHCLLLEELNLTGCHKVDDSTLIEISMGCPNLRVVTLTDLPLVSNEGLKCFARCKNLDSFSSDKKVTDETLVELSKCVNLRKVRFNWCPLVSDRGCAALLAHCPRLQLLNVWGCKGVSNATVDAAIEAVQCRHNGLVLLLEPKDTSVTPQKYENCHPLLHLSYN